MHAFSKILVTSFVAVLACGGTDPLPTENLVPELGRYAFTTTWNQGLEAHGDLWIHAASETQITYTFILNDFDGSNMAINTTSDRTSELDDWLIASASIQRLGDGAFVLLPHLAHIAGGYRCRGNAVRADAHESPLTCRFSYIGQQ